MEPVEQVILHVRTTGGQRAVEIAGATELVRTSDLTEIIGWFSREETETAIRFDTLNLFFHPLPSGDHAIGLVFPAQENFFAFLQPPRSFFVRILVVPPRTLLNYANNPVALYRELNQRRKVPLFRRPPRRVQALKIAKSRPPFDRQPVLKIANQFGSTAIARLVRSLGDSLSTFFTSPLYAPDVIDAMLNLFPVRFRTELTFASELFVSIRNPLRLIGVSGERRQLVKQAKELGVPFHELGLSESKAAKRKKGEFDADSWARLIDKVLRTGNFDFFESCLTSEVTRNLSDERSTDWSGLCVLANHWLRELGEDAPLSPSTVDMEPLSVKTEPATPLRASIAVLPRQRELLTQIDSAIARALFGDTTAIPPLQNAWQELQRLLSWTEQEQLREEFVALIHSVFIKGRDQRIAGTPYRSVGLLDVLLVFLGR